MIKGLDHFVLHTTSIEKTAKFYKDILGLEIIEFAKGRYCIKIGNQKINLHEKNTIAVPKAKEFKVGVMDICFISDTPLDVIKEKLESNSIKIIEYDVPRTGSLYPLRSLYFYDFDGNLIEISNEVK
ncbi:VOC family protein [Arcobacter sp. LA11]|uniref:VOC family protein n=1 Tax=Arcobacter sp. LA11 TaxID=1898176 RepID=UPI0009327ED7|nr:VOC family protein [Arcobacter sp. LA11]